MAMKLVSKEDIFKDKARRRKSLAALPIEEKVRIVVELQRIAEPILKARGIKVKVWEIGDNESSGEAG